MLACLADLLLGPAARVASPPRLAELKLICPRGRPPDWTISRRRSAGKREPGPGETEEKPAMSWPGP